MKRSAYGVNSSLTETTNNHSPKRSCTARNKLFVASNATSACSSSSSLSPSSSPNDRLTLEDNIQSLISMGFINREVNRKTLIKANNDISEAVTLLTSYNYFDDYENDVHLSNESASLISPPAKDSLEQQEQQQQTVPTNQDSNGSSSVASNELETNDYQSFTTNAFLDLEAKVYGDNWSIPYKREEPLGQCLLSATKLALDGTADQDKHCNRFMEDLVPEIFRKLQCTHHVNNWGIEIQQGVYEMLELFIDFVAARLSYLPTPIKLLETLAIIFDYDSIFQRKHRSKSYDRSLYDKQLGDRILANPPPSLLTFSVYGRNETHGWLCQLINRFVSKDGIINLKKQFLSEKPLIAREYNALFLPFVNCFDYIILDRYKQLFNEHIEQAIDYIRNLKDEDFKAKSTNSVFELISTLRKICSIAWINRLDLLEQIHLNLLLKMIALSNFNAKMNSLKELAKMIEICTTTNSQTTKTSIRREVLIDWIIHKSILSKALEGNIDQNQYVEKVRILLDFIAPKISKEDIETIWKMQHGCSSVAVDHLFTLIASAAAKFNLQQLNYLIEFIHQSWKIETILIQEKLIELLGAIGRECQKDTAARVLEILWDMAHEIRLSRSMLDHILYSHLRIFREYRYDLLKRDYCLKCMNDLQRKQGWLVPAIKHLYDLLRLDSTNTFKRTEQDLVSLLVNKHDVIFALIQSLSTCQLDVWKQTQGNVTIDTLVDGRYTHEESIQTHLDLLSFLLKKGNLFLILKRSEELWDTLITNEHASTFDHELGLNWFITCIEDLERESQIILFDKRVSKLNPIQLSIRGYECFKLYFKRCHLQRQTQSKTLTYNSNLSSSTINTDILECKGIDELWNIILCVNDDKLAHDAIRFLLDLYYFKQPNRTRLNNGQILYEYFLKEIHLRLNCLLNSNICLLTNENLEFYQSLKQIVEQLINVTSQSSSIEKELDYTLWLQKLERLLMIIEEYIHIVEHEHSPTAHITSFHSLEYQLKIILGELGKTSDTYDIITVHSNDTLEMLRLRLAEFYKVLSQDIHISIQNTSPLPQSYDQYGVNSNNNNSNNTTVLGSSLNSKYLYQVYITPGTTIYIKIFGNSSNQTTKSMTNEPRRISSNRSSFITTLTSNQMNTNDQLTRLIPSNMLADNSKFYDILYKLSHLNNQYINKRIRNLLYLLPSDIRIHDSLDIISIHTNENHLNTSQQIIEHVFDINNCSLIQLLYNLEILSSKILPLSTNNGIQQSSKIFREDFLKYSGVEFLFRLLNSLNKFLQNQYYYFLCEELILLILQLIQFLICGSRSNEQHRDEIQSSSSMQISQTSIDSINQSMDLDFQATIEHLEFEKFIEQIQQLIFLGWAAAAGNIQLHGQKFTIKEQVKFDRHVLLQEIKNNVFTRNSCSNDFSLNNHVQYGICVKKDSILPLDCEIAEKIIDILTICFEKRPEFFGTFLVQSFFADFLLEILIGTTSREIRQCALRNIGRLCQIERSSCDIRLLIHQILIKARLPLWTTSAIGTRSSNQKLLAQSTEYFDLRCQLTENLSEEYQNLLEINAKQLLSDEINWLSSYTITNELRLIDNILFVGHLKFLRTLLTCTNVDKNEIGNDLIRLLIDQFLFPASKRMLCSQKNANDSTDDFECEPKCSTNESRLAAYDLLVELVRNSPANLRIVIDDLIKLHHQSIVEKQTEWEFMPQVNPRASCGFVGLYNGGATCYMNSILQQLYMLPQISEYILNIHDENENEKLQSNQSNLFVQLQQVFGHLKESKMQYYTPESLWKSFRLWGQEINVCEQQDAFDFFTSLTDQIDEYLKSIQQEEIFHKQFEGIFANQMICINGCHHRYEGEEKFMALNLPVKVDSLNESLNQFVKGELLDGNNSYFCAKCQEKRTTIKRLCIKKLPPLLCIQMKRFGFDWENNRALKFDDYFKFPLILNMEPYTIENVNKQETFVGHEDLIGNSNEKKSLSRTSSLLNSSTTKNYELIGIVIHSGQANAGHYYSFIKDTRRSTTTTNQQWYRFNDTSVEEIQLTEQMLEEECFGGTFRVQKDHNHRQSFEERTRFWNAYMLIYQCIEPNKVFLPPPPSPSPMINRFSRQNSHFKHSNQRDSLSQLADLVVQSEHNHLFDMKKSLISSKVLVRVKDENFEFLKHRDTYCEDYYQFLSHLGHLCLNESNNDRISVEFCTKLILNFLFHTHFRTHRRLRRENFSRWTDLLGKIFEKYSFACEIFYQIIAVDCRFKLYLLDCPCDDIREYFKDICQFVLQSSSFEQQIYIEQFLEQVISLLEKPVIEQVKQSQAYFQFIYFYLNLNSRSIEYLFQLNTLIRLIGFLLGENLETRRWNSGQAKDFGILHEILSILIFYAYSQQGKQLFDQIWLNRYLKELCYAFQEISYIQLEHTLKLIESLMKNNEEFSEQFIHILLQAIFQAHTNDLKSLFKLLTHILLVNDNFQNKRLQLVFEGNNNNGLYLLIRTCIETDQRRAYQTVKYLISLANENKACKDYFSSTAIQWESAINWLKQQMQTSHQSSPAQNISNEDNDIHSFQRTRSALFTLEQAQSLLQQTVRFNGNISTESIEFHDNH